MKRNFPSLITILLALSFCLAACSGRVNEATQTQLPVTSQPPLETQPILPSETQAQTESLSSPTAVEQVTEAVPSPQAASTPTQEPSTESMTGIHILNLSSPQEVSLLMDTQAGWTRFDNFHWDQIEPERMDPPAYQWDTVNEAGLRSAAENEINVIGMILFTPEWAQKVPGVACGPVAEDALPAFADFVQATVERYSQPPFNVKVWEIGNEPDVPWGVVDPHSGYGCWGDVTDPDFGGGYYAEVLKAVYPAIKAADPGAQLLVGGLLLDCDPINPPKDKDCTASRFLEGILKNGGGAFFDGVSFHAYDYYAGKPGVYGNGNWGSAWDTTGPVLVGKTSFINNLLAAYNVTGKSLWNTEVAILCLPEGHPACAAEDFMVTKSAYAAQANAHALAEGLSANIWYHLQGWRGSELVDSSLQPNAAYAAYQFNSRQLLGAQTAREIQDFPGVKGFEITRNGERFWIVWAVDGTSHMIQLPSIPQAVYDLSGNSLPAGQEVEVDWRPVYVEWGAQP